MHVMKMQLLKKEFVRCLNEMQSILVTGVFVAQVDFASLWGYAAAVEVGAVYYPPVLDEEPEILKNRSMR